MRWLPPTVACLFFSRQDGTVVDGGAAGEMCYSRWLSNSGCAGSTPLTLAFPQLALVKCLIIADFSRHFSHFSLPADGWFILGLMITHFAD